MLSKLAELVWIGVSRNCMRYRRRMIHDSNNINKDRNVYPLSLRFVSQGLYDAQSRTSLILFFLHQYAARGVIRNSSS